VNEKREDYDTAINYRTHVF